MNPTQLYSQFVRIVSLYNKQKLIRSSPNQLKIKLDKILSKHFKTNKMKLLSHIIYSIPYLHKNGALVILLDILNESECVSYLKNKRLPIRVHQHIQNYYKWLRHYPTMKSIYQFEKKSICTPHHVVNQYEMKMIQQKLNIHIPEHMSKQDAFNKIIYELQNKSSTISITKESTDQKNSQQHLVNVHSFFKQNKNLADKIALYVPKRSKQRPQLSKITSKK